MSRRLIGQPDHRTTSHEHEIKTMREWVRMLVKGEPMAVMETKIGVIPAGVLAVILEASAALLETHDATGISLDDWTGPRELVELGLVLMLFPEGTLLANGV